MKVLYEGMSRLRQWTLSDLEADLRVLTVWRSEMAQFKAQHIPYKRTSTEWEILGDLAMRLHKREEVCLTRCRLKNRS
jgi:hypothetical protein